MKIHIISGILILGITLFFGYEAWRKIGWKLLDIPHVYAAMPVFFGVIIISILGSLARWSKVSMKWNTKWILIITYMHKTFSYCIIISGFVAINTGIYDYRNNPKHIIDFPLEFIQNVCLLLNIIIMETLYQCRLKNEFYAKPLHTMKIMSPDEFNA